MRVIFRCMTNRDARKIRSCIQGRGVSRPRSEGGGGGGGGPNGIGQRRAPAPPGGAGQPTKQKRRPPPRRGGTVNKTEAACRPGKTKNEPIGRQHVYPKSSDIACASPPQGGGTVNKIGAACRPGKTKNEPNRTAAHLSEIKRYSVRPPGGAGRSTKPGRHAAPAKRKTNRSDGGTFIRNQALSGDITRLSRHSIRLMG